MFATPLEIKTSESFDKPTSPDNAKTNGKRLYNAVELFFRQHAPSKAELALWVTYLNIVLYALCFQLQKPVEPFLVQQLISSSSRGSDGNEDVISLAYGQLQSFFSAIQTIGSPLVGILLDRVGIRITSAMVFLASAASYGILAGASNMHLLFLSKVPTVLQHAFLVAQATAATCYSSTEHEGDIHGHPSADRVLVARAQALGRMTTAYTIGATIGPYIGGQLAEHGDLYIGAKLAVMGSLISVVLSLLFLPSTSKKPHHTGSLASGKSPAQQGKKTFLQHIIHSATHIALRPTLWPLLTVKVFGGVAASMYSTAFPLVLTQQLKFDPAALGLSMSSSMLAVAVFAAFGISPLIRFMGAPSLSKLGLICRAILGLVLAMIVVLAMPSASESHGNEDMSEPMIRYQILLTNVLYGIATHALATSVTTQTTGAVEKDEQGALLGLEHGLFSLARIGGPPLGTLLLERGRTGRLASSGSNSGFWSVAVACGGIDMALVALLSSTAIATAVSVSATGVSDKSK